MIGRTPPTCSYRFNFSVRTAIAVLFCNPILGLRFDSFRDLTDTAVGLRLFVV